MDTYVDIAKVFMAAKFPSRPWQCYWRCLVYPPGAANVTLLPYSSDAKEHERRTTRIMLRCRSSSYTASINKYRVRDFGLFRFGLPECER